MLKDYFDMIYVINIDSRKDRLDNAQNEFRKIGAAFTKVSAVDGYKEGLEAAPYKGYNPKYWNPGAAGLLKSTEKALLHALQNNYKRILICEDDIEFAPNINEMSDAWLKTVPKDWQMFFFGCYHVKDPMPINKAISKVSYAFCLHAYAVSSSVMEYYLHLVQQGGKELDRITADDIQPLGKTYCFTENLAYQKPSFSDIQKEKVDYYYLKKPDLW
jgi:GR25 family glycosyltransferase involved in LPS biosynthesis